MTQPVKKTDTHALSQRLVGGAGSNTVHGPHIWSITNIATGEEVERVEGYDAAIRRQAYWNSLAQKNGQ